MSFCFWTFMLLKFCNQQQTLSMKTELFSSKRNSRWDSKGVLLDWPLLVSHENKTNERQALVFREAKVQKMIRWSLWSVERKRETRHPLWSSSGLLFHSLHSPLFWGRNGNEILRIFFLSREIYKDYSFGEWLRILQVFPSLSLRRQNSEQFSSSNCCSSSLTKTSQVYHTVTNFSREEGHLCLWRSLLNKLFEERETN